MKSKFFCMLISLGAVHSLSAQSTVSLSATPPPIATVDAGNDTIVMIGSLIVLQGQVNGGTAPIQTSWSPSLNMPDSTILTPSVNVSQPTMFYLTAIDGKNCVVVDSVFVDVAMSVKGSEEKSYSVYPNPTKDQITILRQQEGELQVKLLNMIGQTVAVESWDQAGLEVLFEFGRVASGSYLLQVTQDGKTTTSKIIIE
ncbi:MAG: T9SS type A sorting domain-containing protein [Cryomorphaceae bacterium]|nr:T9SS type A sorting domain-containing protein [Cryomorphaceae bacterium]